VNVKVLAFLFPDSTEHKERADVGKSPYKVCSTKITTLFCSISGLSADEMGILLEVNGPC
jgi:hypothetical protein